MSASNVDWFVILGLVLVLEGLLPFVAPNTWREVFEKILKLPNRKIRLVGLSAMGIGLIVILAR